MKSSKRNTCCETACPLSISAMRPLHPLLGGLEDKGEDFSCRLTEVARQTGIP